MAARISQITVSRIEAVTAPNARITQVNTEFVQQVSGASAAKVRFSQVVLLVNKGPAAGGGLRLMGVGS